MMRTLAIVIGGFCVLHLLGIIGLVTWAGLTDRIDRDRLTAFVELFRDPIEEESEETVDERVAREADETARHAERALADTSTETIAERVQADEMRSEMTLRQIERAREDLQSLNRNLQLAQRRVEEQRQTLDAERQAFDDRVRELQGQMDDEGFRRAVNLLESLPPRQAKQMFVEMLNNQEREQVVAYLMAMQPRRAAAVLREFQTADEVAQAVQLTEMLRARGSRLAENLEDLG